MTNAIPEYDEHGLLPEGVYACTLEELRERFVGESPESATRMDVLTRFGEFRSEAEGMGLHATQWVDGSFVEAKPDPADIDVVNWVEIGVYDALSPGVKAMVKSLLTGVYAHNKWRTDSRWIPVIPTGHPLFAAYKQWHAYWLEYWGSTRKNPRPGDPPANLPKGFVKLVLGDPARVPDVPEVVQR